MTNPYTFTITNKGLLWTSSNLESSTMSKKTAEFIGPIKPKALEVVPNSCKNRLYICGQEGYISALWDQFVGRPEGVGLLQSITPMINLDGSFAKSFEEWFEQEPQLKEDIFLKGPKEDSINRTCSGELRFDFNTDGHGPKLIVETLAQGLNHISFELMWENETINKEGHYATHRGTLHKDHSSACRKSTHGSLSSRFHRCTQSGY